MNFKTKLFLAAIILSLITSCLKPPSENDDHGPVTPTQEVQKAISEAWGDIDPATIAKNEFMYLEQDQKISTLDPRVVYKESTEVRDRVETTDTFEYTLLLRATTLDETGSFKPVTSTEQNISVKKVAPLMDEVHTMAAKPELPGSVEALQKSMASGNVGLNSSDDDGRVQERALGLQTVLSMYDACVHSPTWDVTCHNMTVDTGLMPPPTGISSKPNCGGVPNCLIHYTKISFDLVVNIPAEDGSGSHTEKVIYDMTISPDVPYLSRLTEFCYQGLVAASNQKVLVKICNRVQNYELGANN